MGVLWSSPAAPCAPGARSGERICRTLPLKRSMQAGHTSAPTLSWRLGQPLRLSARGAQFSVLPSFVRFHCADSHSLDAALFSSLDVRIHSFVQSDHLVE